MARGSNKLTGGMVISRMLQKYGTNTVFSLAGAAHTHLLDALDNDEFSIISNRHETATVGAADGYARITGKLGVALIISDQGVPNAVTGILTAYEACSPVLIIVARPHTAGIEPQAQVDHDAMALTRTISKMSRTVHSVDRLREYVEVAARTALSGRPGPVVLQVPQEFFSAAVERADELDAPLTEIHKPAPPLAAIEKAAEMLDKAKRPLIIVGGGAQWAGAGPALRKLSADFGIPAFGNAMGRGLVPEDNELGWAWGLAQVAAKHADVVLWVGARMTQRMGYGMAPRFAPNAKFIQIDIAAEEIGRNRPIDLPVVGDAGLACIMLNAAMRKRKAKAKSSVKWIKDALKPRLDFMDTLGRNDTGPIHPYRLGRELMKRMPKDAVYVGDGADIQNWMTAVMQVKGERSYMDHYPLGSMGIGTPLALGAAAGAKEMAKEKGGKPRTIIHVTGDGAFGFFPAEYNGAILGGLKINTFISNDGAWGTEKHGQTLALKRHVNVEFGEVHYDLIGKAFGCEAQRITKPSEVGAAIDKSLAAKVTSITDVVTDSEAGHVRKTDPRVQTIAFLDLVTSRKSHFTPDVA